jgi:hypothetical protein
MGFIINLDEIAEFEKGQMTIYITSFQSYLFYSNQFSPINFI